MRILFTDTSMMNAQYESLTNYSDHAQQLALLMFTSARRVLVSAVPVTGRRVHWGSGVGALRSARHDHHRPHHLMPCNSFRGFGCSYAFHIALSDKCAVAS